MELTQQLSALELQELIQKESYCICGYHGWHDWFITTTDLNNGIPKFNNQLAHSFECNNISSLRRFKKHKNKINSNYGTNYSTGTKMLWANKL